MVVTDSYIEADPVCLYTSMSKRNAEEKKVGGGGDLVKVKSVEKEGCLPNGANRCNVPLAVVVCRPWS